MFIGNKPLILARTIDGQLDIQHCINFIFTFVFIIKRPSSVELKNSPPQIPDEMEKNAEQTNLCAPLQ